MYGILVLLFICIQFGLSGLAHAQGLATFATETFHPDTFYSKNSLVEIYESEEEFNVLRLDGLMKKIQELDQDLHDPKSSQGQQLLQILAANENVKVDFESYKAFLGELGKNSKLRGPTVYYPYGGFDPQTPFMLLPNAVDVFSQGSESFGSLSFLEKWVSVRGFNQAGTHFDSFDSIRDMGEIMYDFGEGLHALGPLAVSRILSFLDGKIEAISFFEIDKNGKVQLLPIRSIDPAKDYQNAVIYFRNRTTGQLHRYWYFTYNLYHQDNDNFLEFVDRVQFDTLLIKGAPDMWVDRNKNGVNIKSNSFRISILPAKRNHARVVTDVRLPTVCSDTSPRGMQQSFWRSETGPEFLTLPSGIHFGYSGFTGKYVYFGSAHELIDLHQAVTPDNSPNRVETFRSSGGGGVPY